MNKDLIIDEMRAIRDAIAREHNYDLDSIFQMLCETESKSDRCGLQTATAEGPRLPLTAKSVTVSALSSTAYSPIRYVHHNRAPLEISDKCLEFIDVPCPSI